MRSTPPLIALALAATLPSCSTWPRSRVPEPTTSVAQPVQEDAATDGLDDADVALAPDDDAAPPIEPPADTARAGPPTTADSAALDEGSQTAPAEAQAQDVTLAEATQAQGQAEAPGQDATLDEATEEPERVAAPAQDATLDAPTEEPERVAPPAQTAGAPEVEPAQQTEQEPAPVATEDVASPAAPTLPAHPLAARGSHISGAELFGADVADAQGAVLGRLADLHVRSDGTLGCVVLADPAAARHAYSDVDLGLDEQGGLLLVAGERCELYDPLRDGAPYRELFVGRQTSTVVGQLTAVETLEGSNPAVTVIKLRAENNHHHRVLVGPAAFLDEHGLLLAVDQEVSVDGIETRDSKGKLWVAGALRTVGRELRLRSGNGEPVWDPSQLPIRQDGCCRDVDGELMSAFGLARWRVRIEGAPELVPCDIVFDRRLEATFLVVHHAGYERLVPWGAVSPATGRILALRVGAAVIAAAPTLPEVTADEHDAWQVVRDWWKFAARPVEATAPAAEQEPALQTPEPGGEQAEVQPPSGDRDGLEPPDGAQR